MRAPLQAEGKRTQEQKAQKNGSREPTAKCYTSVALIAGQRSTRHHQVLPSDTGKSKC